MGVLIGNERFDRYQRQIRVAVRLMLHRARAQVVCEWSGLSPDQIITLRKRWLPEADKGFRGNFPTSFEGFFDSHARRSDAALFLSIFMTIGLHSTTPSLEGAERLCDAYEIFRAWEPNSTLQFDYALLLAMGALKGEEIGLSCCAQCSVVVLVDKLDRSRPPCERCPKSAA